MVNVLKYYGTIYDRDISMNDSTETDSILDIDNDDGISISLLTTVSLLLEYFAHM